MKPSAAPPAIEHFIARWQGRHGGQERANYAMFLCELCDVLDLPRPDPAGHPGQNDYVFERAVKEVARDGSVSTRRMDLYKRDCFVLEAKQSRQIKDGAKEIKGQTGVALGPDQLGRRPVSGSWDTLMMNARAQGESYTRLLPQAHEPPPFLIVCDVGHCFEIYANFRRDGKAFDQFPDRRSFRIYLEDLRHEPMRQRLAAIWTDPLSLDPARRSARVTREIAERLAAVSKALEVKNHPAGDVAMFLMRCLFTMFAEDVGLLPEQSFKQVLERCEQDPATFQHDVGQLWEAMDMGAYAHAIRKKVPRFNGEFFKQRSVLALGREEIGELRQAASYNWREVDPSIFGALLEQALDPHERRKLGAHYTPRAYVERLVIATLIEPLRADWSTVVGVIERRKGEAAILGPQDPRRETLFREARGFAMRFHAQLCATRVLDPACGTGNFLYVALELMKRLEGEVVDAVEALGGQEEPAWLERQNVDPHQFLGMEVNPRAGAIAELVLWIGFLQWHFRSRSDPPPEPILKAFKNIRVMDAVLEAQKVLARDERGKPLSRPGPDGALMEVYRYDKPRRPQWPEAEFIVGNPPFIGGKDLRARLGDDYAQALWAAHDHMNESADFVMYWWDRAAELLTRKDTVLRRFGFVTTNSITQLFQRRVIERHLKGKVPLRFVMAVPDHPWTEATPDAAAVRIAMTVAEAGAGEGRLLEVTRETGLETDAPLIECAERWGVINSDLTVGMDFSQATPLKSNDGICARGVVLHGAGFIVTPQEAADLGLGKRPGLENHIRDYRNGRDLTSRSRGVMVIDLFGLDIETVRRKFPEVYQHVKLEVKEKIINKDGKNLRVGREWNNRPYRKEYWWLFGENVPELRGAISGLPRYIATAATQKHRVFEFIDGHILPDDALIVFAFDDPAMLGVLQSKIFLSWYSVNAAALGPTPRFINSRCFDPFPFPLASAPQKKRIGVIAEELDLHRKRVLADHAHLTLTGLYNVLERLRAGATKADLDPAEARIFDDGLVLILKELHDELDAEVAQAYGWPAALPAQDMLARLVALNKARAQEEARGLVHWLRPDYQIPRFGSARDKAELDLVGGAMAPGLPLAAGPKPGFPADDVAQTAAIMATLAAAPRPLDAIMLSNTFKQGRRIAPKVDATLAALVRAGYVARADGGGGFVLHR